jgi:hypothetical protein
MRQLSHCACSAPSDLVICTSAHFAPSLLRLDGGADADRPRSRLQQAVVHLDARSLVMASVKARRVTDLICVGGIGLQLLSSPVLAFLAQRLQILRVIRTSPIQGNPRTASCSLSGSGNGVSAITTDRCRLAADPVACRMGVGTLSQSGRARHVGY